MATTTIQAAPARSTGKLVLARIGTGFAAVVAFLGSLSNARQCALEVERLMALSEAELARRGLKRDEIVHHAFCNYMHR